MSLRKNDAMADMDIISSDETGANDFFVHLTYRILILREIKIGKKYVLLVTEKGLGKLVDIDEYSSKSRNRKGVMTMKFRKIKEVSHLIRTK